MLLANETRLCDQVFHTVADWGDLQQWSQEILFKHLHFCLNNFELAPVRSARKPFLFTQLVFPCYPSTTAMTMCLLAFLQSCPLVECWQLQCHVGLLERGSSVILMVRSRVWAETFIEVRRCSRHLSISSQTGWSMKWCIQVCSDE